jgi:outer membrane protein
MMREFPSAKTNTKKMKNLITLMIGVFTLVQTGALKAQPTWDLQKCFDFALENNIQVKRQILNAQY